MTVLRVTSDNKIVSAVTNDMEAEDLTLFTELIDDVNSVVGVDPETGAGPIPSFQLLQVEKFNAANILTNFDATTSLTCDITIDGVNFTFDIPGETIVTYQNLIDYMNDELYNGTVSYVSANPDSSSLHSIKIQSDSVSSTADTTTGLGGNTSTVSVDYILGESVSESSVGAANQSGEVSRELSSFGPADVLTTLSAAETYSMILTVGVAEYTITGSGNTFITYQDIVDGLNALVDADGNQVVTAVYTTTYPHAHQIAIVGVVDDASLLLADYSDEPNPQASYDFAVQLADAANFDNVVYISNFDLFTSIPMTHSLKLPVHGGADLADVIRHTYRADKLTHREVVPIDWSDYWWGVAPNS